MMILNSKTVKAQAKENFAQNRLRSIAACLIGTFAFVIVAVIMSIIGTVMPVGVLVAVGALVWLFVLCPLTMGILRFITRMILGKTQEDIVVCFRYFSSFKEYKRILGFIFTLLLKHIGIAFLIAIPLLGIWIVSSPFLYEYFDYFMPVWAQSLSYANVYIRVLGTFVYLLLTLRYYLAPFLFVADEEMHSAEAVYMSKCISKRTVIDFVFLAFSCFWCIVACLFVAPLVFTLPFLVGAYVYHCDSAVKQYNETIRVPEETELFSTEEI